LIKSKLIDLKSGVFEGNLLLLSCKRYSPQKVQIIIDLGRTFSIIAPFSGAIKGWERELS
jgi:hypothetical protein